MSLSAHQAQYEAIAREMGPGFLVRESDHVLLYANSYICSGLGRDPTGETCHKALMERDTPCPYCPQVQRAGTSYRWEYFSKEQGRLYSINHRFTAAAGVPCRACQAEDVSEIMHLSRSAVEYLSLTKFLSDMQARIIGDQDRTLELVMEFLRSHFRAEQVVVTCPTAQGLELHLLCAEGTGVTRQLISGGEPELSALLSAPASTLTVGEQTFTFRLIRPANTSSWGENRQAVLCIVQTYLENAQLRERIAWENHHDKSTMLFNRAHLMQCAHTCYPGLGRVGVIFLDIDNLKRTNDEYGHGMGDRLIQKAAEVLRSVSGDAVHAYRMGGDEFLLVCCEAERSAMTDLLDRVTAQLDASNALVPAPQLSISAGWAHGTAPVQIEVLVTQADEMMYAVKRAKKSARG